MASLPLQLRKVGFTWSAAKFSQGCQVQLGRLCTAQGLLIQTADIVNFLAEGSQVPYGRAPLSKMHKDTAWASGLDLPPRHHESRRRNTQIFSELSPKTEKTSF